MSERNLKTELERLNIVSFDCSGVATKDDVFKALDAIELHMNAHSDKEALDRIQHLVQEKKARRFKGCATE